VHEPQLVSEHLLEAVAGLHRVGRIQSRLEHACSVGQAPGALGWPQRDSIWSLEGVPQRRAAGVSPAGTSSPPIAGS
jgi:hypothetical protein